MSGPSPRVRFAPSPTGALHVGNARTALFNWLFARKHNGVFVLRIEDTDRERSTPAHEAQLLENMRWLGLGWDEGVEVGGGFGPYRQSERTASYRDRAEDLVARGLAYPCFCGLSLLEEERARKREAGQASLYSGRCRALGRQEARLRRERGDPSALRLDVAAVAGTSEVVEFEDIVRGTIRFPVSQIGDHVLLRRDGSPAYNFAVVVDDLAMRITHVIRGDDHLSNTPRQILTYQAMGAPSLPAFSHLPLITAPGGAPLSKREGAASVDAFREAGYPPEALLNHLALLGWSAPTGADFLSREELIATFDLGRVSKAPAVFDQQKLDALSMRHIARMAPEILGPPAVEHLVRAGLLRLPVTPPVSTWVERLAALYSERLARFADLPRETSLVFEFEVQASLGDPEVREALHEARSRSVIETALAHLPEIPLTASAFQALATEVRRRTGAKGRDLYHPIRVGFTGRASGPELVRLLPLLDEGSRLDLPRPVVSCGDRARGLLGATSGTGA
ncbi:MAG TPA: glutamate--tRNA ligase [Candidatus Cryosericum sp.]|nr:glutamate--tRNA ligase [Candidatus Cryosericum sp.]